MLLTPEECLPAIGAQIVRRKRDTQFRQSGLGVLSRGTGWGGMGMRRGGDQTRVGVRVRVSRWVGVRVAGGCFFGEVFRVEEEEEEEAKVCSFVCTCCEDEVKLQQTWVCFPFAAATCSASERVWCLPSPPRVRGAVARRFPHGNYPILTRNKRKRDRRGGGRRKERQQTLLNFHPILPCVPLPPTSPSRPRRQQKCT